MFPFDSHLVSVGLELLFMVIGGSGLWFTLKAEAKESVKAVAKLEQQRETADKEFSDYKLTVAEKYVSKNDFKEALAGVEIGAVFERDTLMPWTKSRAVGVGLHWQPYCIQLPPYVKAADPVRVRQVAWYPGWLGLWHVRVILPDVIDPAGAVIP